MSVPNKYNEIPLSLPFVSAIGKVTSLTIGWMMKMNNEYLPTLLQNARSLVFSSFMSDTAAKMVMQGIQSHK